ncbi:hypothetical protein AVEN_256971-1 [Araneus ventricosus]|uniref:Uncharacterized protein n=1 Tax=Araneus ventricosus TaxID=182803 RepID=A0A4Y2ED79_ARAVE|nr:hypothetical protein AVEN_256971-1 [Araneus ventricosus]
MNFLRQEVQGEEMVNLSRTDFASNQNIMLKEKQKFELLPTLPIASSLISFEHTGCSMCCYKNPTSFKDFDFLSWTTEKASYCGFIEY